MMTEEDYVSLETAKLLKEKGYDEPCKSSRWKNGELRLYDTNQTWDNMTSLLGKDYYEFLCPTLYEAQKWIMSELELCVVVSPFVYEEYDEEGYACSMDMYWNVTIHRLSDGFKKTLDCGYDLYEDAFDKGIQEALKLI